VSCLEQSIPCHSVSQFNRAVAGLRCILAVMGDCAGIDPVMTDSIREEYNNPVAFFEFLDQLDDNHTKAIYIVM